MNRNFDIIIVGAGPAGMTAALYALRSGKSVLLIEKETCGGQIALAPKVENFMTRDSISGSELSDLMLSQIMNLGVEFELETVEKIVKNDSLFYVTTDYHEYTSKAVIMATGVRPKKIGIVDEEKWIGHGLSYCVSCDGPFFKGDEIAVIGDGNSALQYALELSGYCPKVYVCTLFDHFFGDQVLINRLLSKDNVEVIHNILLDKIIGDDKFEGLLFKNTQTSEEVVVKTKGVFIAIGHDPNNEIVKNLVELDKAGYIISNEDCTTSTPGLFVAGDARTKSVRQVATAIADGSVAALQAVKYIG